MHFQKTLKTAKNSLSTADGITSSLNER